LVVINIVVLLNWHIADVRNVATKNGLWCLNTQSCVSDKSHNRRHYSAFIVCDLNQQCTYLEI